MAVAKMETAAEKYRRIKAERLDKEELFDLETPSGMTWKVRRPNLAQFIATGAIPMQLAGKLAKQAESHGGDNAAAFMDLEWDDKVRTIELTNKIVRYCAVSPKIVETPTAPDEIGFEEVELDDYNAIAAWAMGGGGALESLETFRSE